MKKIILSLLLVFVATCFNAQLQAQGWAANEYGISRIQQISKTEFRGYTLNYISGHHYWAVNNGRIIGSNTNETVIIERIDRSKDMSILYAGIADNGFYREGYMKINKNSDSAMGEIDKEFQKIGLELLSAFLKKEKLWAQPAMDW